MTLICSHAPFGTPFNPGWVCRRCRNEDAEFSLQFWYDRLEEYRVGYVKIDEYEPLKAPNIDLQRPVIVVDGHFYVPGGYHPEARWLGFGGRVFTVTFTHPVPGVYLMLKTNNMSHCGEIPREFRAAMPDNATFGEGYKWVDAGGTQCLG